MLEAAFVIAGFSLPHVIGRAGGLVEFRMSAV